MTDTAATPRFSDDRQWWWNGAEWVPASQATQPPNGDLVASDLDSPATTGSAVRNAASSGLKAVNWVAAKAAEQDKKMREQNKAKKDAAAAQALVALQQARDQAAFAKHQAAEQAVAYQVQFDAWFAALARDCPLPLVKSRNPLPGGSQLMNDECLVGTAKHWGFSSERLALTTHRLVWSHGRLTKGSQQLYLADIRDVKYLKPWIGTGT